MTEFTTDQMAALARVKKLMALADDNRGNENEAANALNMAQSILTSLNLSMADLSEAPGSGGERAKEHILGGFYQHERDLWEAIAGLNFCVYWTVKVRYDAETAKKERRKFAHHHRLIGRKVNIIGSQMMAEYLLATVERLTKEFCLSERPWEKYHPRSSTAVSFRQGCAARLIEKIETKRHEIVREEKRKEREAQATASHPSAAPGGSALVVSNLIKSEAAANYDFTHGEGAHARREAQTARWQLEYEQREARELAEHNRRYASDEKYRKQFDREQEKDRRRWEREANRSGPTYKGDHGAFNAGYRKGGDVSLDAQIGRNATKAIT